MDNITCSLNPPTENRTGILILHNTNYRCQKLILETQETLYKKIINCRDSWTTRDRGSNPESLIHSSMNYPNPFNFESVSPDLNRRLVIQLLLGLQKFFQSFNLLIKLGFKDMLQNKRSYCRIRLNNSKH